MNELKPCPFCEYEHPTMTMNSMGVGIACPNCQTVFRCDCTAGHDYDKNETLKRWNRRPQPANEPLTLDELREMDGEPVFLIIEDVNGFGPITMWALVEIEEDGIWMTNNLGGRSYYENALDDGINVYARKPEPEGGENDA